MATKGPYESLLGTIAEILERAADGRLSKAEAADRLDRVARSDTATDYARDAYGPGMNPQTAFYAALNSAVTGGAPTTVTEDAREVTQARAAEAQRKADEERAKQAKELADEEAAEHKKRLARFQEQANAATQVTGAVARGGVGSAAEGVGLVRAVGAAAGGRAAAAAAGPIGIAAAAVATVIDQFGETVKAFIARGKELAGLDATLAAADANADVRKTLADVREAQRLGKNYGSLIDSQSSIEDSFRKAILPLQETITGLFAKVYEAFAKLLEALTPVLEAVAEAAAFLIEVAAMPVVAMIDGVIALAKKFTSVEDRRKDAEAELNDIARQVLEMGDGPLVARRAGPNANQGRIDAAQRLNLPLFAAPAPA